VTVNHVTVLHVPVTGLGTVPVVGAMVKLKAGQDGVFRVQELLQASVFIPFQSSHCSDILYKYHISHEDNARLYMRTSSIDHENTLLGSQSQEHALHI